MLNPYLFVYGTLMRDAPHSQYHLLKSQAEFIGAATFQGQLFLVAHYPGMIVSTHPDDSVHGEVYKLHQPHKTFEMLDDYEGCSADYAQPTEYVRCEKTVVLTDGNPLKTWLYLYNLETKPFPRIVSGRFAERN